MPGAQADVNLDTCIIKKNKKISIKLLLVTGATSFNTGSAVFFPPALLRFSISKITSLSLSKYRLLVGPMDFYRGRARGAARELTRWKVAGSRRILMSS